MEKGILLKKSVFIQEFAGDVWEQYDLEKVRQAICRKWAVVPSARSLSAAAGESLAHYVPSR